MNKMLKTGGQVLMIEFHTKNLSVDHPIGMEIAREDSVRQMQPNGFKLAKEHTLLPYRYFLTFTLK
jgi:hypothetical protein